MPPTDQRETLPLIPPCVFCGYNSHGYWQKRTHGIECPWYYIGGEQERQRALRSIVAALAAPPAVESETWAELSRYELAEMRFLDAIQTLPSFVAWLKERRAGCPKGQGIDALLACVAPPADVPTSERLRAWAKWFDGQSIPAISVYVRITGSSVDRNQSDLCLLLADALERAGRSGG